MTRTLKALALCTLFGALAGAPAPLRADPPDASFLPQCPDGTMFRLLMMRCVPYDKTHSDENHHTHDQQNAPPPPKPV